MLESLWMGSFISRGLWITSFCSPRKMREIKERSVLFVPSETWDEHRSWTHLMCYNVVSWLTRFPMFAYLVETEVFTIAPSNVASSSEVVLSSSHEICVVLWAHFTLASLSYWTILFPNSLYLRTLLSTLPRRLGRVYILDGNFPCTPSW